MCYKLCAILSEYYQERIMVRLFVFIDCGRILFLCNDLFRLFVSFFVVLIKRRYATNTATATRTAKKQQVQTREKTTTLHVHHAFWYISLPSSVCLLWRGLKTIKFDFLKLMDSLFARHHWVKFHVCRGREQKATTFFFDAVLQNSTPKEFANI